MTSPIKGLTEALRAELEATPGGLFVADIAAKHGRPHSGVTATLHHLRSQGLAASMPSPITCNHRRLRWYAPKHAEAATGAEHYYKKWWRQAPKQQHKSTTIHAAIVVTSPKVIVATHQWTHDKRYQLSPAEAQAFRGEFCGLGVGRYL